MKTVIRRESAFSHCHSKNVTDAKNWDRGTVVFGRSDRGAQAPETSDVTDARVDSLEQR